MYICSDLSEQQTSRMRVDTHEIRIRAPRPLSEGGGGLPCMRGKPSCEPELIWTHVDRHGDEKPECSVYFVRINVEA